MDYRYGSHTVYQIEYHFVWVTKGRRLGRATRNPGATGMVSQQAGESPAIAL
jgi:Transposase and inactivated derivatives